MNQIRLRSYPPVKQVLVPHVSDFSQSGMDVCHVHATGNRGTIHKRC